jgi:hypothetical protein
MCENTLIDVPADVFPPAFIKYLTLANCIEDVNYDGFGFFTFANKKLVKSKVSAQLWWRSHYNKFVQRANNDFRGIYHVRRASTINQKFIDDKYSHPFLEERVVLTHNGTITEKRGHIDYDKITGLWKDEDIIDTQKFLRTLNYYKKLNKSKLDENVIKSAIDFFDGPFAMLIHNLNDPTTVWVTKGSAKSLVCATFLKGKQPIGFIINTNENELIFIRELLYDTVPGDYNVCIEDIPKEGVYKYTLGSYTLGEKLLTVTDNKATKFFNGLITPPKYASSEKQSPLVRVVNLCTTLSITFTEIMVMCEVGFHKSIFLCNEDDFTILEGVLFSIVASSSTAKQSHWGKIMESYNADRLTTYKITHLSFPYHLELLANLEKEMDVTSSE